MSLSIIMLFVFLMVIGMIALVVWYLVSGYSYSDQKDTIDEIPSSEEDKERK